MKMKIKKIIPFSPLFFKSKKLAALFVFIISLSAYSQNTNPTVDPIPNQLLCPGIPTASVHFSGALPHTIFRWINNNPAIGLPACGVGDINSFLPIPNGTTPVTASITVTPILSSGKIYFQNFNFGKIYVVDRTTNAIETTIRLSDLPEETSVVLLPHSNSITLSPDKSRLYVSQVNPNALTVINTVTNTLLTSISIDPNSNPYDIRVSPDGSRVYVLDVANDKLLVFDAGSFTQLPSITVGDGPTGIAISPDGGKIYVSNFNDKSVSVIATGTNSVLQTLTVPGNPSSLIVSPDGLKLYVANFDLGTISRFNTSDYSPWPSITTGIANINNFSFNANATKLFVLSANGGSARELDLVTATITASFGENLIGAGICVSPSPEGSQIYVSAYNPPAIYTFDACNYETTNELILPGGPVNGGVSADVITGAAIMGQSKTFNITVNPALSQSCIIISTPSNNTYTGGNPNNLYLGYGPQRTTLRATASGSGSVNYNWSGNGTLNCYNCAAPVFAPSAPGIYTFNCTILSSSGCSNTCSITICVADIKVSGSDKKVYLCHKPTGGNGIGQQLAISVNAVPAHLTGHPGDKLGICGQGCNAQQMIISNSKSDPLTNLYKSTSSSIFPNPAGSVFKLVVGENITGTYTIRIYDAFKRLAEERTVPFQNKEIFLGGNLKRGIYFIELACNNYRELIKVIKTE